MPFGDGGDEVFGGYGRYVLADRLRRRGATVPRGWRHAAAALADALPSTTWDFMLRPARLKAPPGLRGNRSGDRVHKVAALMRIDDPDQLYRALISVCDDPYSMVMDGGHEPPTAFTDPAQRPHLADYTDRMMYFDTVTYLPAALAARPKQGFAIPLAEWLRGPLRDWAETLLDERRLSAEGFLHAAPIRRKWRKHASGARNWSNLIWNVLMFQAWQERWLGAGGRTLPAVRLGRPDLNAAGALCLASCGL